MPRLPPGPQLRRLREHADGERVTGIGGVIVEEPVEDVVGLGGGVEGVDEDRLRLHERVGPSRDDYVDLMVNSSYTYSVFGLAFSMFAIARK